MTVEETDYSTFSEKVQKLAELMNPCTLCPRKCRIYRSRGEAGFCGIADKPVVSSVGAHFGEESVLVGFGGSGTIFFTGCNLGCIFCQNYDISHYRQGREVTIEKLSEYMLSLQSQGCSNINLVTPTHQLLPITAAVELAKRGGLTLPIIYNSGGYDLVNVLEFLEGMIDVYMPDMKYDDPAVAKELSGAADYPEINKAAVKQMYKQVGDLVVKNGLAEKGLLIRHLVLPDNLAGSFKIIDFLAGQVSPKTAINVMGQYRPCYKAAKYTKINRRPTMEEIEKVRLYALEKKLNIID